MHSHNTSASPKIWFLQLARALACILVVYTHWYGLIVNPNSTSTLLALDPLNYPQVNLPDVVTVLSSFFGIKHFSAGFFSVGLFFLLSGYVIPMSLKGNTPLQFLIRRLIRVYPVALICLTCTATVLTLVNYYTNSSLPSEVFSPHVYISNVLLIKDFFRGPYIDNASWTLLIEMHFYLLIFLLYSLKLDKKPAALISLAALFILLSIAAIGATHLTSHKLVTALGELVSLNTGLISFMLVGTLLYYLHANILTYKEFFLLASIFITSTYIGFYARFYTTVNLMFLNYCYVLLFFNFLYLIKNYIPYSKVLNKIADISYPLYLLHGFCCYAIFYLLFQITGSIGFAFFIGATFVIVFTFIIHFSIEKPSIKHGKIIALNFKPLSYSEQSL